MCELSCTVVGGGEKKSQPSNPRGSASLRGQETENDDICVRGWWQGYHNIALCVWRGGGLVRKQRSLD